MVLEVTDETFQQEVVESKGVVIVDFYASWCMPCKMLAPIVEKVANDKDVKLAKINIDENEELVKQFKIMSVPTLKIFKDGKEVKTMVGLANEARILDAINV